MENLEPKKKQKLPSLSLIIIVILILIIIGMGIKGASHSASPADATTSTSEKVSIDKPQATQTLNKAYDFPLKDTAGKQLSTIKYQIVDTELRDQVLWKGQTATAVAGRTFLILNLKLTNSYNKAIQINASDYVRLRVNNSGDMLAPDLNNDPVTVQAISTKYTQLGFPIDDDFKSLTLQIGEISGKKDNVTLSLK